MSRPIRCDACGKEEDQEYFKICSWINGERWVEYSNGVAAYDFCSDTCLMTYLKKKNEISGTDK
jgi:hypothetical protein